MRPQRHQRPQESEELDKDNQIDRDFKAMENFHKEMQASSPFNTNENQSNPDANMVDNEDSEGENIQDEFPSQNEFPSQSEFPSHNEFLSQNENKCEDHEMLEKDAVKAAAAKARGNDLYKQGLYMDALTEYSQAVVLCPDEDKKNKAIYHSNKAACYFMTESYKEVVDECNIALQLDPKYIKTYIRRSKANEKLDKLTDALNDMNEVVKLDPTNSVAVMAAHRLTPLAKAQQEKMKDEMLGKLKDLGNSFLGKFGMSIDNFKATKDPKTGSYNISMQN